MTKERFYEIAAIRDELDDMPDGAFFALSEEMGVDQDDWIEFADLENDNVYKT